MSTSPNAFIKWLLLALFPRSLQCGDSVRSLRNFCRADEATAVILPNVVRLDDDGYFG